MITTPNLNPEPEPADAVTAPTHQPRRVWIVQDHGYSVALYTERAPAIDYAALHGYRLLECIEQAGLTA